MNRIDLPIICSEYAGYLKQVNKGQEDQDNLTEKLLFLNLNLAKFAQKIKITKHCLNLVKEAKNILSIESGSEESSHNEHRATFRNFSQSFVSVITLSVSHLNL